MRGRPADRPRRAPLHDYEPGDVRVPMHTDPLCRLCGQPRKSEVHR